MSPQVIEFNHIYKEFNDIYREASGKQGSGIFRARSGGSIINRPAVLIPYGHIRGYAAVPENRAYGTPGAYKAEHFSVAFNGKIVM